MILDPIKFRELMNQLEGAKTCADWGAENTASRNLERFLLSHASELLAVVEAADDNVPKHTAWDAAVSIPRKVQGHIDALMEAYTSWAISRAVGDPDLEHKHAQALSTALFAMKPFATLPPPPEPAQ